MPPPERLPESCHSSCSPAIMQCSTTPNCCNKSISLSWGWRGQGQDSFLVTGVWFEDLSEAIKPNLELFVPVDSALRKEKLVHIQLDVTSSWCFVTTPEESAVSFVLNLPLIWLNVTSCFQLQILYLSWEYRSSSVKIEEKKKSESKTWLWPGEHGRRLQRFGG
jgi:hypothetical protein